jgi:ribosome-associated protein
MIKINNNISIDENELSFNFIRSSGPGGQNVNKVSTAVQLKFDILNSAGLSENIKQRIITKGGKKVSKDGTILIEAKRFRTQEKNKQDALNRLITLIKDSSTEPKIRKKTKPTKISSDNRITEKKQKSEIKKYRKKINDND